MLLSTAFYQTGWWAVCSTFVVPFGFMLVGVRLQQWMAEHRGRVLAARKRASMTPVNPLLSSASSPHASSSPQSFGALSLAEVAEERSRRRRPAAPPAGSNETELMVGALIAVVSTLAYLYLGDLVRVLIGILGATGIGYAYGRLGGLHKRGVVADDWMRLRLWAIVVFALDFLGLYLLVHPLFADDRLGALLTAFRHGGVGQVTALGGLAGWFIVGQSALGALVLICGLAVYLLMLCGLSARGDQHGGILLRWPRSVLLRWDEGRGRDPSADLRWAIGVAIFALVFVSGSLLQGSRILRTFRTLDAKPRISQLTARSRNGRVTLGFGLDRNATVRVTLRRSAKTKPLRSLLLTAHAGTNVERFVGRHDATPLGPGRYQLLLSASADRSATTGNTTLTVR